MRTEKLEYQSSRKRYLYGKDAENNIINCLRKHYNFEIEDVDKKTDCESKIDCLMVENNEKKPCQVKTRMGYSGKDILIDVFEPFYGIDNKHTRPGRDYVGQYEKYIVMINDKIHIIEGKVQKKIIENVLEEWKVSHFQLPVFNSYRYGGIQLRYTQDRNNHRPKVLMFIPVTVYEKDEINTFQYKN